MADDSMLISEVVGSNVMPDLQALIDRLVGVEAEIAAINAKTITITVDLKGAESLTQIQAALDQQQQTLVNLTQIQNANQVSTQQLSAGYTQFTVQVDGTVRQLVEQKNELKLLNEEIKRLETTQWGTTEAFTKAQARIVSLTEKQLLLKQAIAANNKELKENITVINNTSNSFNVLGISAKGAESLLARMTLRMVAMNLLFTPAIAGIEAMVEAFTKLSSSEQLAADMLEEYNNGVKEAAKNMLNLNTSISAGANVEENTIDTLATQLRYAKSIEARVDAYNKLKEIMPGVLRNYTQEQVLAGAATDAINEYSSKVALLKSSVTELNKVYTEQNSNFEKTKEKVQALKQQFGTHWMEGDKDVSKNFNDQLQAVTDTKIKLDAARRELAEFAAPDIKEKKGKQPNSKFLNFELELEKAEHEKRLLLAQKAYDDSNRTFDDEKKLNRVKLDEATRHADSMVSIIIKWHGKVGEDENKFKARIEEAENDRLKVANATSEAEKKIAEEIRERHNKAGEDIDKQIIKWREYRQEIDKFNREIELLRAKSKSLEEYASGVNPILSGLGIDTEGSEEIKEKQLEIKKLRDEAGGIGANIVNSSKGKGTLKTNEDFLQAKLDMVKKEKDISKLELEIEDEKQQKIIDAKKRLGEELINLTKQTIQSIKTIQDNQFEHESQQIQIQQQKLEVQNQQKIEAINATTGYQITKDNQLAVQAAQHAAKQNELQQQQNQLALKRAKADKAFAEMQIITGTAASIIQMFASMSKTFPEGIPVAIGLAATLAATGAVQYAAAASAPLPQFFKGGITQTPIFSAAEIKPELGVTPQGTAIMFNKPGAYTAPIGTQIFSGDATERIIRYASNQVVSGRMEVPRFNMEMAVAEKVASMMVAKMPDNEDLVRAIYATRPTKQDGNPMTNELKLLREKEWTLK